MSDYLNKENLDKFNKLIDDDKTIVKDIFRKQLLFYYSDYKKDIITYTKTNKYTVDDFYKFLRQFLTDKNDLISTVNNYNLVDKFGLSNSIDVINQLNTKINI
jgi:hypothetical protein